jgi:hypothetical protein
MENGSRAANRKKSQEIATCRGENRTWSPGNQMLGKKSRLTLARGDRDPKTSQYTAATERATKLRS